MVVAATVQHFFAARACAQYLGVFLRKPCRAGGGWGCEDYVAACAVYVVYDFVQPVEVEFAFPWSGMKHLANGRAIPPKQGDLWRLFFARYEKLQFSGREESLGWAWDKIGHVDNHTPELWTPIEFSEEFL